MMMNNFDFATTPQIQGKIPRSKFNMPHNVKFTANVGQLIPFECTEILPGDTLERDTNSLVRLQTLLTPIMDDLYLDTFYFFVPNRLVWDHWEEFCGANKQSAWYPTTTYSIPQITVTNSITDYTCSVADYLGVPFVENGGTNGLTVSALPFRAYGLIYNEWFRDEALQDYVLVPTDDTTTSMDNTIGYKGKPFLAGKYHDYFSSATPEPQRGPEVSIPLSGGTVPVTGNGYALAMTNGSVNAGAYESSANNFLFYSNALGAKVGATANDGTQLGGSAGKNVGVPTLAQLGDNPEYSGLVANLETGIPVATINTLRMAFATQQLYEIDSNGGRYTSILRNHFGVISPDARLQRPELLAYDHKPLNVTQVVQNSGTGSGSSTPQGTTTAFSVTGLSDRSFKKSFVEHGYVIGLMVVRYKNTYQQGLHRMWSRLNRFDFYWPVFANLGNQPIYNKEIFATATEVDDEVFGYQEAWADYRYTPDRVAGEMRSVSPNSLDFWHLADDYETMPYLSPEWITVDAANVNRVLAVSDSVSNQLLFDVNIQDTFIRPMPVHSVPGLYRM